MLNETFMLCEALRRADIVPARGHPRVKLPGKSACPCLRMRLGPKGKVVAVESLTEQEWPGLWTVREGNQNSFPVVRVKDPLIQVARTNELWKRLGFEASGERKKPTDKERFNTLAKAVASCKHPKVDQQFWERLSDKAAELLGCCQGKGLQDAALRKLTERFRQAAEAPDKFLKSIATLAVAELKRARLDAGDTVEMLVVGKGPPNREGRRPDMTVQLVFDLDDETSSSCRLYSGEMRNHVIRILPVERDGGTKDEGAKHRATHCAVTGTATELQTASFPKVMLPVLNKEFPLVSMFGDAPCNTRYRLTNALIVPVAKEAALRMQDALAYIVDESREGKTWRGVGSGKFEVRGGRKREVYDLLIVYLDGKPELDVQLADMFGTGAEQQEKKFEADASAVCDALDGFEREHPGSKINLFVLRKVSEGQAQVALAESPSVAEVLEAARRWQEGVQNVPNVSVPLPGRRGKRPWKGNRARLILNKSCDCWPSSG